MADAQARLVISAQDKTAADFARVKTGLDGLQRAAQDIGPQFSAAAAGITALLASAGGAVIAFRGIVDGVDALNDLKDATGASIENLSGLERVARLNGGTLESVSGIIVKFNKGLKDADGENGVSKALKAIGLDAAKLRQQDPALALQATAIALAQFEDNADKARLVQELFGKSLREAAPFLKDLAESGQLNATVTTEQAEAAERFNKQLFALKNSAFELARSLVGDLVPALSAVLDRWKSFKESGGLSGFFGTVGQEVKANLASDQLRTVVGEIESLQKTIDRQGATSALSKKMAGLREQAQQLTKEASAASETLKKTFSGPEYSAASQNDSTAKRALPANALGKPKAAGAAPNGDAEFQTLLDRLNKRSAAIAQELAIGRKLTESEQLQIETEAQLTGQKTKLTAAQQASVRQALAGAVANGRALEAQQELAKTTKAITDLEAQRFTQLAGLNEQAAGRNESLREELAAVGKTAEQLDAMATARLRDAAARQAIEIIVAKNAGATAAEVQQLEQQLALLRESVTLREAIAQKKNITPNDPLAGATKALDDYLKTVANTTESTRQAVTQTIGTMENALVDALSGKRVDAKGLIDSILQEFLRLQVVKPLLASIFTGGPGGSNTNAAAGIFSAIFGGGGFGGFFANGGNLGAGKWGIAGEAGPELIKGPASVVPISRMPSGIGGGGMPTIVQNITVNGGNRNELMAGMQQARRAAVADIQELQRRGAGA